MKICIGICVEADIAKAVIKELIIQYNLKLVTDQPPIVVLPDDDRAFFFCETADQDTLDALDIDEAIEVIWYDPQLFYDVDDVPVSGESEAVSKLEALLKMDVE